jgi:hypothetical protein
MVDLIERGQPALFLCHWPGMYCNGTKAGFRAFQRVVTSIGGKYADRILWLKLSEIARYWAAKELTEIQRRGEVWALQAPFACPDFTLTLPRAAAGAEAAPVIMHQGQPVVLERTDSVSQLSGGRWHAGDGTVTVCFALPQGLTEVRS